MAHTLGTPDDAGATRTARHRHHRYTSGHPPFPQASPSPRRGPPGAGKTTVARLYGGILTDLGVLRSGHLVEVSRTDLMAQIIGGTAVKSAEAFYEALGGVLFIAADYTRETRRSLDSDPGLASRFSRAVESENYTTEEPVGIMARHAADSGYDGPDDTLKTLHSYVDALPRDVSFDNARTARQILDVMTTHQARRLSALDSPGLDALRRLLPEDVPALPGRWVRRSAGGADRGR